jgi:4-amino-4-deoxy-L-arabinose transferase-like glycosyltransferase
MTKSASTVAGRASPRDQRPVYPMGERTAQRMERLAPWLLGVGTLIFQLPFLNRGVSVLDEGSILAIADGLRHGEVLYRDRVTPVAPLTYELMRGLMSLFGPTLLVGRLLLALVFTLCTLLIYAILRKVTNARWALSGALAFLVVKPLAFPFWTIVNYSQIAMLFWLLTALAFLLFLPSNRLLWLVVAGVGVGLTSTTKQNLGVLLGIIVGACIFLDAWRNRELGAVPVRCAALAGGVFVPLLVMVVDLLATGTLDDFLNRAVFGLADLAGPYLIPLPWAFAFLNSKAALFAYLPSPLLWLGWEGYVSFGSPRVWPLVVLAIELVYFLPLSLTTLGLWEVWRSRRRTEDAEWSRLLFVCAFGAAAYFSMLYRADWTHLMNIQPPLLIVCVTVLHRICRRVNWGKPLARGLSILWLTGGLLAAVAVFIVYVNHVVTPRGPLLVPSWEADSLTAVLRHVERQPRQERILFLCMEPLYYFLTDRRVPNQFDLVAPGYFRQHDDERIAESLSSVDQVIFNPQPFPTLPMALGDYAPRTAMTLAETFQAAELLSPTACLLRPAGGSSDTKATKVDLWDELGSPDQSFQGRWPPDWQTDFERVRWMVYRVVAQKHARPKREYCFEHSLSVGTDDSLQAIPIFHPETWASAFNPGVQAAEFRIQAIEDGGRTVELYAGRAVPAIPRQPLRVPLDRFRGRRIRVRFCTELDASDDLRSDHPLVGWAEPRVVQGAPPR